MPCFPDTTLARLIATSCHRLDSCYTIICLNPKDIHNSYSLIGLQQPPEKRFPPIHILKSLLKNPSCAPETAIYGHGPSNEYIGWPNIVDDIDFMNLSTMDPLVLPQVLSTMVANNVSKLSTINVSGEGVTSQFSLWCVLGKTIVPGFIPG